MGLGGQSPLPAGRLPGSKSRPGIHQYRLVVEGWIAVSALGGPTRERAQRGEFERRPPIALPSARRAPNPHRRTSEETDSNAGIARNSYGAQYQLSPDLYGWQAAAGGPDTFLEWLLVGQVGGRRAGGAQQRISRRALAGRIRQSHD